MKGTAMRALGIAFCIVFSASALLAQIPVTDDAFTSSAAPTANYGVSVGLVVQSPTAAGLMSSPVEPGGSTANTYLKFDLAAAPSNINASNLSKGNLRLYVDFVVSPGSFDVYLAAGPWSEGTLNAGNAPGLVGSPINSSPIAVTKALKYIDIDITPALISWLNGTANSGLVLVPSSGSNIFASFDSKENPLTAHDPQLSVSVNDASSTQLQQEVTRATQAENLISSNLANEVVRAEGAEGTLNNGLNGETARAKNAESSLGGSVANEALRAQAAEGTLTTGLNQEIVNRVAGDSKALSTATSYTDTSVGAEATLRAGGDTALQTNIAAVQSSLSGYALLGTANKFTANQAINGDLSANNVNAAGQLTANGALLPAVQMATPAQGFPSNPFDLAASASDGTSSHNETFRWQAVPVNNGTPNFAAQLNLLYGGGTTPSPTGFSFNSDGTINFAVNQRFPGISGDVTGVTAGTDLTGGGTGGNVTLNLNVAATDTRYAQLGAPNTFTRDQLVIGNFNANSLTVLQNRGPVQIPAFTVDSSGNLWTEGTLLSDHGGLVLGGLAPLNVNATGVSGDVAGGRFTVLGNGNVGIGNPNPTVTLDVAGAIHASELFAGSLQIGFDPQMSSAPRMSFSGSFPGAFCADITCGCDHQSSINCFNGSILLGGYFVTDKAITITHVSVSLGNAVNKSCGNPAGIQLLWGVPGNESGGEKYIIVFQPNVNFFDSGPLSLAIPAGNAVLLTLSQPTTSCTVGSSGGGYAFVNAVYVMQ